MEARYREVRSGGATATDRPSYYPVRFLHGGRGARRKQRATGRIEHTRGTVETRGRGRRRRKIAGAGGEMGDRERLVRDGAAQLARDGERRGRAGGGFGFKKEADRVALQGSHLHLDVTRAACTGPNHSHRRARRRGLAGGRRLAGRRVRVCRDAIRRNRVSLLCPAGPGDDGGACRNAQGRREIWAGGASASRATRCRAGG
ncbi:hypothetical protein PVAP13_2NG319100 [Panicum virgatum]|uniref:Uncharacterized protein n=1 Tax=Panicum virgatum TaxID=38727 RepID=A0A8T0VR93_PANVG|nr:hypothetical protein PVAP13_2NG319100 [Panicum virgatum]